MHIYHHDGDALGCAVVVAVVLCIAAIISALNSACSDLAALIGGRPIGMALPAIVSTAGVISIKVYPESRVAWGACAMSFLPVGYSLWMDSTLSPGVRWSLLFASAVVVIFGGVEAVWLGKDPPSSP